MPQSLIIAISSEGDLERYIRYCNLIPIVTEEQEHDLSIHLRDHNDMDAARQLVLSHLRLVISTAHNFIGYELPLADLIQECNLGLMKVVINFDPN